MNREPQWLTLPPTPVLPGTNGNGYAPVNGIEIRYAMFGRGEPVILLHGGLANSNYWGNQVPVLAKDYQVIVIDSRVHGRSSRNEKTLCLRVDGLGCHWSDGLSEDPESNGEFSTDRPKVQHRDADSDGRLALL
jgi:pimeloyl-ACP methyl ester carboxylesterase